MPEVLLCNVNDDIRLYLYKEILKKNNIHFTVKKGNVYVPGQDYERAFEVTRIIEEEVNDSGKAFLDRRKKLFALIAALVFIGIPIIYTLISYFINNN
jgi:hypothetical protein